MELREQILDYSRQNKIGALSPWYSEQLDKQIASGKFHTTAELDYVAQTLTNDLQDYRIQTGLQNVVLGMSGGVDSALTAALFKRAGWRVIGVTMPIHQNQDETDRGQEAIEALGLEGLHIDLSELYDETLRQMDISRLDISIGNTGYARDRIPATVLIRRGNVRARLRMITLYNLASARGGLVASTDNFSELAAGFWTLHGDVGDLSPIQSLLKSWEVPYISSVVDVPESTWRATPTDGLGISNGDEAQLGASYLEWDLMINEVFDVLGTNFFEVENLDQLLPLMRFGDDERARLTFNNVLRRVKASWFKRKNPVNLRHPIDQERYRDLAMLDHMFTPEVVR